MKNDHRHILWSITINNPEEIPPTESWMESTFKDVSTIHYMMGNKLAKHALIGKEHWKGEKTPHFQIALCTSDVKKFSYMKGMFPRAHIQSVDYPYEVLVNYCKKGMNFTEHGKLTSAVRMENEYRKKLIEQSRKKLDKMVADYYNKLGIPEVLRPMALIREEAADSIKAAPSLKGDVEKFPDS